MQLKQLMKNLRRFSNEEFFTIAKERISKWKNQTTLNPEKIKIIKNW